MTENNNTAPMAYRDSLIAQQQVLADAMVGKAITAATVEPHDPACDGSNVLRLAMSDGTTFTITGGYGGYTGESCDEYMELLTIQMMVPDA